MNRSEKVLWVTVVLVVGGLAALPFRKQQEPAATLPTTTDRADLPWRLRDVPLQVPSSGVSPATGLYESIEDGGVELDESTGQLTTTPTLRRQSELPTVGPPTMDQYYRSPLSVNEVEPEVHSDLLPLAPVR